MSSFPNEKRIALEFAEIVKNQFLKKGSLNSTGPSIITK